MSEKRKPDIVILLKKRGKKTNKIELFNKDKFKPSFFEKVMGRRPLGANRYRLRVNGKWFNRWKDKKQNDYLTKWEFRDVFFKSLNI